MQLLGEYIDLLSRNIFDRFSQTVIIKLGMVSFGQLSQTCEYYVVVESNEWMHNFIA